MQAIKGFCFVALVEVMAEEPEQTGEIFWAGFTVGHGTASFLEEVIEDPVEWGNYVFLGRKSTSKAFVSRSFPTASPF